MSERQNVNSSARTVRRVEQVRRAPFGDFEKVVGAVALVGVERVQNKALWRKYRAYNAGQSEDQKDQNDQILSNLVWSVAPGSTPDLIRGPRLDSQVESSGRPPSRRSRRSIS